MAAPFRVLELLVSTDLGGGPAHVRDLVAGLAGDEFQFTVAGPPGGAYEGEFTALGARFVSVRSDRLSPAVLRRVVRLIREHRIEIVHSHGKGAGLYGRIAARLTGAAAIHTFHGIHYRSYPRLYLTVERYLARHGYAVVHVSASQAREAQALGLAPAGRSRLVVNGVDAARVRAAIAREPLSRAALGLDPGALVLGTVARFDPVKGLDVLLRAFAQVLARRPNAQLLLVGDGPEAARLRDLAGALGLAGRAVFAGPVKDAARGLPALDLYVSASHREGLPLALLEAMVCGLPVLATRVPGHVDVVEDGVTGVLVPPGDPAGLAAAAVELLEDPTRRRALGEAGRARAETHFALSRLLAEMRDLYREAGGFHREGPHVRGV
ncbi:MAG TPA: glycosyltransferase family 4 protein [Candidatus Deferrimicrobiaceae bacterium]|nr:glycosyltransferase family 4 protein [Candidatus Deferrimicrobiaceae bacterium]